MLTEISGFAPFGGSEPFPVGQGRYGIDDQMRAQETLRPGMAVSRENASSNAANRNFYKYGNVLARPEFYGVLTTKGSAPSMDVLATTSDSDTVEVLFAGYAPVLLAPGEIVKPGQRLEPISGGLLQGMFRIATSAFSRVVARDYVDNSASSVGVWVGADIFPPGAGSGLIAAAVGPSAALTGVTAETAYGLAAAATIKIPAYSFKPGDRGRIVGSIGSFNGAVGGNALKVYFNGIGSGLVCAAPTFTPASGDVVNFSADFYVNTGGNVSLSGFIAAGAAAPAGAATARPIANVSTFDPAVANTVTVTNTPSNAADTSRLLFLSVEKLA